MNDIHIDNIAAGPQYKERPEADPLAKKWAKRYEAAKRSNQPFHKRIKHNRKLVSGLDWERDVDSKEFYMHRANLIQSTITALLPNIYARNPEITVQQTHQGTDLKVFCKTLEKVTNRYLENAQLKARAKATVRAALTCSYGVLKVAYQQGTRPLIKSRIQDAQDNLARVNHMLMELADETARAEQETVRAELEQTLKALHEEVEVALAEGIVIDRVLTENLLIDPSIVEFWDYDQADWMIHLVPMKKAVAEGEFGYKLDSARSYNDGTDKKSNRLMSSVSEAKDEDTQVCILEIWDRQSQRVYTMAEGCDFWLREPYSPECVGERWYPFFLLPFQTVDGCFIGPSIVELTEKLQDEHNTARDRYNEHRDLIKPGYIASAELNEKTLKRFTDSELGEITLIDAEGQPIQQAIMPKQHPPFDPAAYDTSQVRYDWEMVSGMQDASRSTVVRPKTATEASIMQQSLSGRISEFRDQVEDFLQQLAQYAAEILIQVLAPEQVEKITGRNETGNVSNDPSVFIYGITKQAYDWPQLSRDEVFDLVQLRIRAGTTGLPDKLESQDVWAKLLPTLQPLITQIMQIQAQGQDPGALINLVKETINRFDERLDPENFIPTIQPPTQEPLQQPPLG